MILTVDFHAPMSVPGRRRCGRRVKLRPLIVVEVLLEVEVDFSPGTEAKTYGAPEDCYPGDGGDFEVLGVTAAKTGQPVVWTPSAEQLDDLRERAADLFAEAAAFDGFDD